MSIPVESFAAVDGSMSSEDGQTFYYHARRDDGSGVMLGFPHAEIPNLIECAAIQTSKARDKDGDEVATAFITGGFQVGRGPEGETVLSMTVGGTGKISFLLPEDMRKQLVTMLVRSGTRH